MKKTLIFLLSLPTTVQADCVMQDRVVARSQVQIEERSPVRRDIVPDFNNQKRCLVDFRVRIGSSWHSAMGQYTWDGQLPADQACARAVLAAEEDVRQRVGRSQTVSEKILVCKDEPKLSNLSSTQVGTVGDVGQFRPHPEFREKFYHNGTECKWFIDTGFTGRDVRTYQGIICRLNYQNWVVVDKF